MEERSLDLIVFIRGSYTIWFSSGRGAFLSIDNFLDKVKVFIFVTAIESVSNIVIYALYVSLTSVSTSKNISDQRFNKNI